MTKIEILFSALSWLIIGPSRSDRNNWKLIRDPRALTVQAAVQPGSLELVAGSGIAADHTSLVILYFTLQSL